jgi:reactive intermediate/imine deaminase
MRRVMAFVAIAAACAPVLASQAQGTKETVNGMTFHMPQGPSATRPYTPAVQVGNLLFLSGQIGTSGGNRGIEAETKQTLENIKSVLEASGSDMEHVAKCTVFLADMAEFQAMNAVYTQYFKAPRPARSAVGVNGLAGNARVEIECIANIK